jgi:hypothetical protein
VPSYVSPQASSGLSRQDYLTQIDGFAKQRRRLGVKSLIAEKVGALVKRIGVVEQFTFLFWIVSHPIALISPMACSSSALKLSRCKDAGFEVDQHCRNRQQQSNQQRRNATHFLIF